LKILKVLIADEQEVVRQGVRVHLEAQSNWQLAGEASDGKEAIRTAIQTKPDVAVLAYELPVLNGIDVTAQIRRRLPSTEVVIYTSRNSEHLLAHLLRAGARGIVFKSEPISRLIEAIRAVAARKSYFGHMETFRRIEDMSHESASSLTPRERSVVQLIAEGNTNKEVARLLGIALKTIETHRANVMNKLELGSSAALVRYAVRNQIVEA
jgi:DNA-binding NarL/FixJ family response regulator